MRLIFDREFSARGEDEECQELAYYREASKKKAQLLATLTPIIGGAG
jgi:hypothetical protein